MAVQNVVLLPGWGFSKASFDTIARDLSEDFAVHGFDLTGLGPSYAPALARATEAIAGPLLVLGWSLGGTVALELAARPDANVVGLVLVGSVSRLLANNDGRFGRTELDPGSILEGLRQDPRDVLARFFRAVAHPGEIAGERLESRIEDALSMGPEALTMGMRYLQATDVGGIARTLELPASVLHGKADAIMPWRSGRLLARALRGSQWTLCEGVGHDLPLREPALVCEAVRDLARRAR